MQTEGKVAPVQKEALQNARQETPPVVETEQAEVKPKGFWGRTLGKFMGKSGEHDTLQALASGKLRRDAEEPKPEADKPSFFLKDTIPPPDENKLTPITDVSDELVVAYVRDKSGEGEYHPITPDMAQMSKLALEVYKKEYTKTFRKDEGEISEGRQENRPAEHVQLYGPVTVFEQKRHLDRDTPDQFAMIFNTTDYKKNHPEQVLRTSVTLDTSPPDLSREEDLNVSGEKYIIGKKEDGEYELVGSYNDLREKHGDELPAWIRQSGYIKLAQIQTDEYALASNHPRERDQLIEAESQKRIFYNESVPCESPYSEYEGYSTNITAEQRRTDIPERHVFLSFKDRSGKQTQFGEVPIYVGDENTKPKVIDAYTNMVAHACAEVTSLYRIINPYRVEKLVKEALYPNEQPSEPGRTFLDNLRTVLDHDALTFDSSKGSIIDDLFKRLKAYEVELPVV